MNEQGNKNRLNWTDYFMAIAMLSAYRSCDPSTQVGCVIVKNKRIVGMGYNGYPVGVEPLTWERDPKVDFCESKYSYVVHSEVNAVLNTSREDCKGATAYMTLFPCNTCAGIMISSGIKKIIFSNDKYHDMPFSKASRILLRAAKIPFEYYSGSVANILVERKPSAIQEEGLG